MNELLHTNRLSSSVIIEYPESWQFMHLADGLCHYRVDGPDNGDIVILIHGATVPAWEFDRLVPHLNKAGYKTIRADLYGHGYSDRPEVNYDISLFTRQVMELLERLNAMSRVHILGHSLGAVIGASLLAAAPDRFSSLVLAAPLINYVQKMPYVRVLNWPIIGECLMYGYVKPMLVRRRTRRYRSIEDGRFVQKFKNQLLKPGFGRALLSMFRMNTLGDQLNHYRPAAQCKVPTLILRGEYDQIVSRGQVEQLAGIFPESGYRQVNDTAHAFLLTDPERIAPILINFMRSIPAKT